MAWSASLVRTRYLPVRKLGILDGLTLLVRISDDVDVKNVIFNFIPALRTKLRQDVRVSGAIKLMTERWMKPSQNFLDTIWESMFQFSYFNCMRIP